MLVMKRRVLTEEEQEDARRLRIAWDTFKNSNQGATQEWLAKSARLGKDGTQGAAGQYLRGVIPLNLSAALRICNVLGVELRSISPRLAVIAGASAEGGSGARPSKESSLPDSLKLTIETAAELRLITVYRLANEHGRGAIDDVVDVVRDRLDKVSLVRQA